MDKINSLIEYFKRPSKSNQKAPEGYCPNCWGEQEYDTLIRKLYVDKQVDVNNHKANYSFIKDFVVTQLDGIHLKRGDNGYQCPTCHVTYPENQHG